ncbi:MAG: hypothetical protein AB9866_14735 [Syntrophobacteraceae bacterium]
MVEYLQLAHNVRHSETGIPVAEIVHNFGRADELNRDDLVRLCRSIARVCGLEVRDPLSVPAETTERQETTALPEDVKLIRTLELGVPFVDIKLCVFALLIERVAELKCKEPWPQIKRTLATLQATEFHTPKFRFFQRNEPSSELLRELKSLEIPIPKTVLNLQSTTSNT